MARRALAVLSALAALLLAVGLPSPALAADPDAPPSPYHLALRLAADEAGIADAQQALRLLAQQPTTDVLLDLARHQLEVEQASFRYRESVRAEQGIVYRLAADPGLEAQVLVDVPSATAVPLARAIDGLRALWRAAGIDDLSRVRIRWNRDFTASAPVGSLLGYYHGASAAYPVDWSYLASINFIESDFGRNNGPSSAGAMGPMQFMPATWQDYGAGGDIMSPHDSIYAAARYLYRMGAPGNMDLAILRYNNDDDYVASVESFAAAFRADPSWLERVYYWSTAG